MLSLLSYLLGLLIFPSVQGGIGFNSKDQSLCVLQDEPRQCGSFCLAALNPIFDDTDNIRMTLNEIKAELKAGFDSRVNLAEEEHMAVNSDVKNKLQELRRKVSQIITKEDFANSIKALQAKLDSRFDRTDELRMMKITADANDELKIQVNTLKDTIKYLQSQLKISEGQTKSKEDILKVKEELIKRQHEHLKNRDEQISTLTTQIKAIEKTKSVLSNQLTECRKTDDNLPDSCPNGSPNGIYQIKLRGLEPFEVPCATDPPGWTVIQRRIDGSENFNRTWNDYKSGFGNVSGEFFIGLEKLHRMTEARPHQLYIKLGDVNGSTSYAHYDDFMIGSEEEYYKLKNRGRYFGEAGDSLKYSKNQKFSTFDQDNDSSHDINCASTFGAWWHHHCSDSGLNGKYSNGYGYGGVSWDSCSGIQIPKLLTFVEMMIRPKF